ncbi:hypothetical protein M7I_7288 [Glarea lozoyensis 74030]|uniref:Uncharacterized protein n=1 Tax=Glarea lozoyensis (strain ATCC 74030 / MF5533) TaxID=1104152 RepID=H0EWW3_GLAL7|nr:hypothetical protein M7I_7288 [Glarea lozoyensis 74030]
MQFILYHERMCGKNSGVLSRRNLEIGYGDKMGDE